MNVSLAGHAQRDLKLVPRKDPVLHRQAQAVDPKDPHLDDVFEKMEEAMYQQGGCGLAGPQVGIPFQMMVVDTGDGPIHLANPRITESHGGAPGIEGCLSLGGTMSLVWRPTQVKIEGIDSKGQALTVESSGFKARALQHELDHLNGELMSEKALVNVTAARALGAVGGAVAGGWLRGTPGALVGGALGVAVAWGVEQLV